MVRFRASITFRFGLVFGWALWLAIVPSTGCAQSLEEFDASFLAAPADGPDLSDAVDTIAERTNDFRGEHELRPLERNQYLTEAAEYFAAYMARTGEYGHEADGNRPSQRAALHGYEYCLVAENIGFLAPARGIATQELAQRLVDGWIDSESHRRNLLDPDLTEIGIAVAYRDEDNRYFGVQLFGRPKEAAVRFEVVNQTADALEYTVAPATRAEEQPPQSFDLPPRSRRVHQTCRPPQIRWPWSDERDRVITTDGETFVISRRGGEFHVEQAQPADASGQGAELGGS